MKRTNSIPKRTKGFFGRGPAGAILLVGALALGSPVLTARAGQAKPSPQITIQVLSSRPDMISGGEALIRISMPASRAKGERLSIKLRDKDVTAQFKPDKDGLLGVVGGLTPGTNVLSVQAGSQKANVQLVDFPVSGPVFSGPHQAPFVCETAAFAPYGLGAAKDTDCNADTVVSYFYKSTEPPAQGGRGRGDGAPGAPPDAGRGAAVVQAPPPAIPAGFKKYDASAPRPADMAQAMVAGKSVDYIVRVETGVINRAVYQIGVLAKPGDAAPNPWAAPADWNGRLVYSFGGGCAGGYHQGRSTGGVLTSPAIGEGYAVASSSLNVLGNNCNDVLSAETMMMVKEHFITTFGPPVHTIGQGGSGGAMQQNLIAANFPGLLDGIMPSQSFPDTISETQITADCMLLEHYFGQHAGSWTDDQRTAVAGLVNWPTCKLIGPNFAKDFISAVKCDSSVSALAYDPASNRTGARCDYADNEVNVFGRDSGTGFARRPYDNVGVQYGLNALNEGKITSEEFLDLNEFVGGFNLDGGFSENRHKGDSEALRIAYETGRFVAGGAGLSSIPMIDLRTYSEVNDVHDRIRSFMMRARLTNANGNAGNQVMLTFPRTQRGNPAFASSQAELNSQALRLMDQWLDNVARDSSTADAKSKVARNKPPELVDACWTDQFEKIAEPAVYGAAGRCNDLYPTHLDARLVAGAPMANEMLKCQLKPPSESDYTQKFSPQQWERLRTEFPEGVCDFSKPGVGQVALKGTWLSWGSALNPPPSAQGH